MRSKNSQERYKPGSGPNRHLMPKKSFEDAKIVARYLSKPLRKNPTEELKVDNNQITNTY